jgi:hypothetical protein
MLLLCQSIALAAIAVQDYAITAHPKDILLGNGLFCVFHVHVEDIICILEVEKVIFAVEFASCAGGDRERERNEEREESIEFQRWAAHRCLQACLINVTEKG